MHYARIILLIILIFIVTVPLHEAVHYAIATIEPQVTPSEIHLFDSESLKQGYLGFVVITENYPGAFNDRLPFMSVIHELLAYLSQIVVCIVMCIKVLR